MNRLLTWRAVALSLLMLFGFHAQSDPLRSENHCDQSISLIFSPAFVLCLPLDFYRDSAIAAVDGFVLKFKNGESFYGHILVAESEGLPPDLTCVFLRNIDMGCGRQRGFPYRFASASMLTDVVTNPRQAPLHRWPSPPQLLI